MPATLAELEAKVENALRVQRLLDQALVNLAADLVSNFAELGYRYAPGLEGSSHTHAQVSKALHGWKLLLSQLGPIVSGKDFLTAPHSFPTKP